MEKKEELNRNKELLEKRKPETFLERSKKKKKEVL